MTIQWHLTTGSTVDVLQVSGYLGDDAVARFTGAVGWAVARGRGALLLDLTQVRGWSKKGRLAVLASAQRFTVQGRALGLVSPPDDEHLGTLRGVTVHADLEQAKAAHAAPAAPDESGAVWHSNRWSDQHAAPSER